MRARYDKSHHLNRNYQQLVPLVLGLQACINSIIYKVLGQLRPLDRNREILEQCTWIGPRLLRFEHNIHLIDQSTYRGIGLGDYDYDMHAERSEALAENIIQILAQHMTGQVELEPAVQCALSTSLILLLSFKMATNPSAAVGYLRKLIQANFSQLSGNPEHTRITLNRNIMADQWNRTTFALLGGAIAVANTSCFVKESPCYSDALSENDTSGIRKYCVERVVELGWQCLISAAYPGTSSFNEYHYLKHGMLHLLPRAEAYSLSPEDYTFIHDLLKADWMDSVGATKEDHTCRLSHVEEFTSALTTSPDLHALTGGAR